MMVGYVMPVEPGYFQTLAVPFTHTADGSGR